MSFTPAALSSFIKKWTDWLANWAVFLLKHTFVSLCLNAMIYAEFQKIPFFQVFSFFAYIIAHLGMFEYYFGSSQPKPLALAATHCKKSPTLNCKLNCVSDQNATSHISNESQVHAPDTTTLEKAFTVKVNHDLIVSIKEIKALLWSMNQRLCTTQKSSKSSKFHTQQEICKDSDVSDPKSKIEMPNLDKRSPKRLKCGSFNGIENVGWDE